MEVLPSGRECRIGLCVTDIAACGENGDTNSVTVSSSDPGAVACPGVEQGRSGQLVSSSGLTSLQNTSIVRLASSTVMSPVGICSTM